MRSLLLVCFIVKSRAQYDADVEDVACAQSVFLQVDVAHQSAIESDAHTRQPVLLSHTEVEARSQAIAEVTTGTRRTGSERSVSQRQRQTHSFSINWDVFSAKCIAFIVASLAYAAACVMYSFTTARGKNPETSVTLADGLPRAETKTRVTEWDYIKIFGHLCIVYEHFYFTNVLSVRPTLVLLEPWGTWNGNLWTGFMMSLFAVVSGIFGQKVSYNILCKTLCYTFGTAYLVTTFNNIISCMASGEYSFDLLAPRTTMGVLWYLGGLGIWRLVISPLFSLAESQGISRAVPFLVSCIMFYAGWHVFPLLFERPYLNLMTEAAIFALAPFFALGHLLPSAQWTSLIRSRKLVAAGFWFTFAWYAALVVSPSFRSWNKVACLGPCARLDRLCHSDRHFPQNWQHSADGFSFEQLRTDTVNYLLKGSITLAVMFAVGGVPRLMLAVAPKLHDCIAERGVRTFYGYVLHYVYFNIAALMGFDGIATIMPVAWIPPFCLLVAVFTIFILTSTLTERLFSWLVMPLWLMRIFKCSDEAPRVSPPAAERLSGDNEYSKERS
eukprot:TRINITY_DN15418_c0_g2_i1.p1 TRINITY_DN15418_c0_g2~~TRINITY_DN15418_c0_g2_i1.p1  ORF type:complete len:555 (-),score=26.83 TRINITY_DN15418_c0_g2_i1:263-1927(-)